jgi:hypothetical protein
MKRICCLLAAACLTGCAGTPEPALPGASVSPTNVGVFVGVGPGVEAGLADEAAKQLWNIYPPPKNLLDFRQRATEADSFGPLLMSALQREGYFVHRSFDPAVPAQCGKKIAEKKSDAGGFRIVPVCYLVDDVSGMLRLTLFTGGESWSRFFETTQQGRLKPVGAWTQQRGE